MNDFAQSLFAMFWYAVLILLPGGVFALLMHFLLSLPMRRRDRALFFLDLLETVLQRGQPVEQAILSAAENHDRAIGVRFFMVAAHIEGGARLGEALEKEPRFLPPQVNAMLSRRRKARRPEKSPARLPRSAARRARHRPHHDALHGGHSAAVRAGCLLGHQPAFHVCHSQIQGRVCRYEHATCGRWRCLFFASSPI